MIVYAYLYLFLHNCPGKPQKTHAYHNIPVQKNNLMQNYFQVSGKPVTDYILSYNNFGLWSERSKDIVNQEAQLPFRNRASVMNFFVAKLLSIAQ